MTNPNPGFQRQKRAGLQVPAGLSPDLARFLQGLKEAVQSSQGTLGQPQERFVSVSELERLGVVRSVLKGGRAELRRVDDVDAAGNGTPADVEDDGPAISDSGAQDRDFLIYNAVQGEWLPFGLFDEDVDWSGQHDFVDSDDDQVRVGYNGSDGYIALSRGSGTTAPGYARFYDAAGVSRGYVGNHDSASRVTFTSENGWGIRFASATDVRLDATEFEVNATLMDFNGSIDLSGDFFSVGDFEVYCAVGAAHFTINDVSGAVRLLAGNPAAGSTGDGATATLQGGLGGFTSGYGGTAVVVGGDSSGVNPGGLGQIKGGKSYGTAAGGDVAFTGGESVSGQGGNGVFYAGAGGAHDGDLYFGTRAGTRTAIYVHGDSLKTRFGAASVEFFDGSVGAPSISFVSDTNTGVYSIGPDNLGIVTGGTLRGDVDTTRWLFALPIFTPASIAGAAGLRLPHGTTPTLPVDGDTWTTTAGLFVQIDGVTVGPLGTGSGSGSGGGYPQQLGYAGI